MHLARHALLASCLTACAAEVPTRTPSSESPAAPTCDDYPDGAVSPMALGEVIEPYRWPVAIHRGTGLKTALDLADVPCNAAPDIDWSPFDVLLFVSIPAW